ncbi:hypothetical protein B0H67DRAFT_262331 [Lasiosphaeris hirsuta]|uniref:Uncharacterized protein n=1 Tax=Lasiosphaeris hirsuta TaxID=260670 RepID=A0AA40A777_9PEZI|nr:hypothetical protein B0H67DRAFT_262331 [Lasiosphaeris hirsuta]
MDPISILGLAAAVVSAIFAMTGPIMKSLWNKLKSLYGRVCKSTSYLQGLGRERLTGDIQRLMHADKGLARAAERRYLKGGAYEDNSDFSDF